MSSSYLSHRHTCQMSELTYVRIYFYYFAPFFLLHHSCLAGGFFALKELRDGRLKWCCFYAAKYFCEKKTFFVQFSFPDKETQTRNPLFLPLTSTNSFYD